MALSEYVPWGRFSLALTDEQLKSDPRGASERLRARLNSISPSALEGMRCEMACAATHMTWEARSCPPASCALAAQGEIAPRTGVLATLLTILSNRRLPLRRRRLPRACPCERSSDEWHLMPS